LSRGSWLGRIGHIIILEVRRWTANEIADQDPHDQEVPRPASTFPEVTLKRGLRLSLGLEWLVPSVSLPEAASGRF